MLLIVAAASIFGWLLTVTRVTDAVAAAVLAYTHNPAVFLLLANLLMLFVGCFSGTDRCDHHSGAHPAADRATSSAWTRCTSAWWMVLNLMIGLLHPPMGMVLFVLARVAKLSLERTTIAILPWLVPLLGSLILITYSAGNRPVAAT